MAKTIIMYCWFIKATLDEEFYKYSIMTCLIHFISFKMLLEGFQNIQKEHTVETYNKVKTGRD